MKTPDPDRFGVGLVGRDRELAQVRRLVAGPDGGAILLRGDPGIGKSTLLDAARQMAIEAGALVVHLTGVESEAQFPFAGLHQLLAPLLPHTVELPTSQREGLEIAFGMRDGPRPDPYLIAIAAAALLKMAASEQRVVVIADDVQWLDIQSLEVVPFVARRVADTSVVVIAATRNAQPSPFADAGLPVLDLVGLDHDAARRLVRSTSPTIAPAVLRQIEEDAAGNPLALLELPRVARDEIGDGVVTLPVRLERAFAARFEDLAPAAQDVVLIAALNPTGDIDVIRSAAAVLHGSAIFYQDIDAAERGGLVQLVDSNIVFRHPLVRSGVLQAQSIRRRHAANAALAEVLVDDPYRSCWHRAQSIVGPDDAVADALEDNVSTALSRGAVNAAIRDLERAAQLTNSPERRGHRLLIAAQHAFSIGRGDEVHRLVGEASQLPLSPLDLARVQWLREIFSDGVPGDATRVLELCDTARQSAEAGDLDLALNLLLGAALRCWWAEAGPDARRAVVDHTDALDLTPDNPMAIAVVAVAEPVERAAQINERLDIIDIGTVDDPLALHHLGMAAHAIGDSVRASDLLTHAEDRLRDEGRLALLAQVVGMHVNVLLELGEWDRADQRTIECRRVSEETGQPGWSIGAIAVDARSHALRGNTHRALELVAEAELLANRQRLNDYLCCAQVARGVAFLADGRATEAFDALARVFDPHELCYHQRESFIGLTFLAEAARTSGRQAEAAAIVEQLELVAEITPSPILQIHLDYARAVLSPDDTAEVALQDALGRDLERWPWPRSRLHLAYGTWLAAHNRHDEAIAVLEQARDGLAAIGAQPWAELVRRQLHATDQAPRNPTRRG
jgi:tetratricopeptide (TPR) repeat protein